MKDQLGGLDHMAAWYNGERASVPGSVFVSAGPLFYLDPTLREEKRAQERTKAETLAASLKGLDLAAFAPGRNDWALGTEELSNLSHLSGAPLIAGNAQGAAAVAWRGPLLRDVHGIKVGIVGVAAPDQALEGAPLGELAFSAPTETVKSDVAILRAQGAQIIIVLAAVGRGEAKRLADTVPDVTAILVGSTGGGGDDNTPTPAPELVGDVVIAQTGNHLQTVAVLDLFVREGSMKFQDGTGLGQAQKREELMRRIDELHGKIADWEKDGTIAAKDLDARRVDLAKLESDLKALGDHPPPAKGSYFRYSVQEVRDGLGVDATVHTQLLAYYKEVNDANRKAFAAKMPAPAGPDGNAYAGVESCVSCHPAAKAVWDKTRHARAYDTLVTGFKEFNLDCVSCHVTGYDRPGGSTVTHVEKLQGVQCEVCHGPSSKHVASSKTVLPPVPRPNTDLCEGCHHPPHVHQFDGASKLPAILGPGHGMPLP
ncbi:MAG TPA: multiheme c-type cytochrome [Polyangiaceae bacterium]